MDGADLKLRVTGRVSNKPNLPTYITVSESPVDAQAEQLRVADSAGVGETISEQPTVGNTPGAILPHPDAAQNSTEHLVAFLRVRAFPFSSLKNNKQALVDVVEHLQATESRPDSSSLQLKGDAPANLPKGAYLTTTSVHCVPAHVDQMHKWPDPSDMITNIKQLDRGILCRI